MTETVKTLPSHVTNTDLRCPACQTATKSWFTKHTPHGDFPVRRCPKCQSAFALPRPSWEQISGLYRSQEGALSDQARERPANPKESPRTSPFFVDCRRIAARIRALTDGTKALDVGAGNGFHSEALIDVGFQVDALEPNAAARDVFRKLNGFEPIDGFLDAAFAEDHRESYDAVLVSQVMEHLIDPGQATRDIHRLLRPGGIAAIAVPMFRSWFSILCGRRDRFITPPEHLNYFTKAGLQAMMNGQGLTCGFLETVTWFETDQAVSRFPFRWLGWTAVGIFHAFSAVANRFRGGNTLEAYFRKAA